MNVLFSDGDNWYPAIIGSKAVCTLRDIPICNLLAKCWEMISLVDFLLLVFYVVRKTSKSVASYLLMNINELVLWL